MHKHDNWCRVLSRILSSEIARMGGLILTRDRNPLSGRVAVVTGATRNAGRGIAIELGIAGATVYCTGRSLRGKPSPRNCTETIEETAEMVEAHGGKSVWVQVDHTDIGQVDALFDRVLEEQGRLDLLVNAISGNGSNDPFLQTDLAAGLQSIVNGGHSHIIATHIAARRMAEAKSGLIISISDHEWDQFYAMEKALMNRITVSVADEFRTHGITILSLLPGAFFAFFKVVTMEELLIALQRDPGAAKCHTPRLIGRGVVALATDPNVMAKTGALIELKTLVGEYGLADIDGRQTGEMW
jgi:NAD(P)-dependent dehydrogenase (short-subunit alcohol dehydrogenase family)